MHLLYIDESGAVTDPNQSHFILAGISVFERKTHWIEQRLNNIAERFDPVHPHEIELHGSPMRSGREGWKRFKLIDRLKAIDDALHDGVASNHISSVRLFGAVIKKSALKGKDPVDQAFTQIASRFDQYLGRLYSKHDNAQRGIIIFDKSSTEKRIQTLARDFKYSGHNFGRTKNYAEVPVFLDSKASRLIQLADLIAFAMYRKYAENDDRFYKIIKGHFDSEGGVVSYPGLSRQQKCKFKFGHAQLFPCSLTG